MIEHAESFSGAGLLDPRVDPAPVEIIPAAHRHDLLLVCEHAGRAVPRRLNDLGLGERELGLHIAWDIGAEAVARGVAERLGCALIVQRYSRLVIDCNRPPLGVQSIPEISDGVTVPGNLGLDDAARRARVEEIFAPFARACESAVAAPGLRAAHSIHSFTPVLAGVRRPWDAGFLHRAPFSRGAELARAFRAQAPGLLIAENEPYRIEDATDWFIPCCAEPRGLPHSLVEIRNDAVAEPAGAERWAEALATLFAGMLDAHDGRGGR